MATDTTSSFKGSMIDMVGADMTKLAANKVYDQSHLGPTDVQVIELHDCFSANEMVTYEALNLCEAGEAPKLIDRGDVTYGGKWVVNPSGGLISKGHPLGATGLAQCAELCWQLRGMAGKRQVPNCRVALQHNIGLGGAAVVGMYRLGFPEKFKQYPKDKPNPAIDPNTLQTSNEQSNKLSSSLSSSPSIDTNQSKSGKFFDELGKRLNNNTAAVARTQAVFQFDAKNKEGKIISSWTIDLKNGSGSVKEVKTNNPDVIITALDDDLSQVLSGKINPQQAFLQGKLKSSGNMKFVLKLGEIFKQDSKL